MTNRDAIDPTPKNLRKFGLTFAVLCVATAAVLLYKGSSSWPWLLIGFVFFLVTGIVGHRVLRPIYIGWMKFAFFLGWINTKLLLGVFFYIILTPTGILMRLFGKDLLDEKLEPDSSTYWKKRTEPSDPRRMERQF